MPFSGLSDFIGQLEKNGELSRIKTFVSPELEVTEITDRITKSGGKALLFEENGTKFPVLINAYGSDKRMAMAISRKDLNSVGSDIVDLFGKLTGSSASSWKKLFSLKDLLRLADVLPYKSRRRGKCQKVLQMDPDLSILPVLKCWPHDGGRFITLPMVHTVHPVTGKTNVGMYRMQVLGKNTAGMHWQRHKTGAGHFEAWKASGARMPVTVALGGDPVYSYCASAPLPENIDEYILAGFLRGKKVKLVKSITNDLFIPDDADIVIEGYVDPAEDKVVEGPFGDHTGFYSLADHYPRFHVTCITYRKDAVYPATIVGIPPQEDAWLAKATERIFLAPVKLALQPEIEDFHLPDAGVAHNLAIVRIKKTYPGQGKKVINSLLGAGQMMFTKYLVVTSGEIDIRNYRTLAEYLLRNTDLRTDLLFSSGPLDVLDHSSDVFSLGGKLGIDSTIKLNEELLAVDPMIGNGTATNHNNIVKIKETINESGGYINIINSGINAVIVGLNCEKDREIVGKTRQLFRINNPADIRLVLAVDHSVDVSDLFMVAWQVLGNSDPGRDINIISDNILFIDGTMKAFRKGGFPRKWPNVVCSSDAVINGIDKKWGLLGIGPLIPSPSLKYSKLLKGNSDEITQVIR